MIIKNKFIKKINLKKVLVIGDLMIDAYDFCYSSSSRPSPEKSGTKVYLASKSTKVLGGAGNVAANLASLGVQTSLVGLCGDDGNSVDLKKMCSDAGINAEIIIDQSRVTTLKTRIYIDDNYHMRKDIESSKEVGIDISYEILSTVDNLISDIDAVILSDYNKGFFTQPNTQELIKKANKFNLPIIVDFKPSNSHFFRGSTLMAPNLSEAISILPEFSINDPGVCIQKLHSLLGSQSVMVTLGAAGLIIYDGTNVLKIDGLNVPAIDPCGCGDTVRACLTVGLICGLSLYEAASFANYAASLVVQRLGTVTLNFNDFENYFNE